MFASKKHKIEKPTLLPCYWTNKDNKTILIAAVKKNLMQFVWAEESISPTFYDRICANILVPLKSLTFTASTKKLSAKLLYKKAARKMLERLTRGQTTIAADWNNCEERKKTFSRKKFWVKKKKRKRRILSDHWTSKPQLWNGKQKQAIFFVTATSITILFHT